MASVIDYIECPNCKHEAYSDFYYKTGEEYVNCNNCGYIKTVTIKDRTKNLSDLTQDDWEIQELKNPYGAYRLKTYQSIAYQLGSFENKEQYNEFKQSISNDLEIEHCSVSRLIDGEIIVEEIVKNLQENE